MHVRRYGPGESAQSFTPGDFILTHRNRLYSWVISHGQRLAFRGKDRPYAHWSHAAFVETTEGGLIEARGPGVVRHPISEYENVEYHYVHIDMDDHDRTQAVAFAQACVGQQYGFLTILSLSLMLITRSLPIVGEFSFGLNGTEICSGLVARCMERGKYIFKKAPNTIMPGDLAKQFEILPTSH